MIKFNKISKYYGSKKVLNEISFKIKKGETFILLGESGCGKTTTLKMINKLIEPSTGEIFIAKEPIHKINSVDLRKKIGYVIQDKGLFPHYTVGENIGLLPKLFKWNREKIDKKVDELLGLVELDSSEFKNRYPNELSGGQQQRISIARALAADPEIILMDEPFGALDNITRKQVRNQFKKIESLTSKTIILVTHDISEAVELGDKICLMHKGNLVQTGTPFELLFHPKTAYVKDFFHHDKFQTELQLITLKHIFPYIDSKSATHKNFINVSISESIQTVIDILSNGNSLGNINIIDTQNQIIKSCSFNEILKAFTNFKNVQLKELSNS